MAYCPKCKAELSQLAIRCDDCGYSMGSESESADNNEGFAYSSFADLALFIGSLSAAFVALSSIVGAAITLIRGDWVNSLILMPITFFLAVTMLVVFVRTYDQTGTRS